MSNPRFRHSRIDAEGRAQIGSQRQLQTYVNDYPRELNAHICNAFGLHIGPVAAPLEPDLLKENGLYGDSSGSPQIVPQGAGIETFFRMFGIGAFGKSR